MNMPKKPRADYWAALAPKDSWWANLLSVAPPIIQTFTDQSLGAVGFVGPHLRQWPVHFLLLPTWSLELEGAAAHLAQIARRYRRDYSRHALTFLCATDREAELMRAQGCAALTVNQNSFVNEAIFKPLPEIAPQYDAIYNARLKPYKNHELAASIDSLALLTYSSGEPSAAEFHAHRAHVASLLPRAHFLNELTADGCRYFDRPQVNEALALARVGLCLSTTEGAMFASMEYLLAGLSVVSTRSVGGRDYFFDEEFCIVCDADPRSISAAVDALVQRNVPRNHVRAKTLARVEAVRRRYIDFVQDLIDRGGGTMCFADRFRHILEEPDGFIHWRGLDAFVEHAAAAISGAAAEPATFES
jgi:glycosyltransferase involved in cell wall biosynthesis